MGHTTILPTTVESVVSFLIDAGCPDSSTIARAERLSYEDLTKAFAAALIVGNRKLAASFARPMNPIAHLQITEPNVLYAAREGDAALLGYLLDDCLASADVQDWPRLRTALSHAAENGHAEAVALLLRKKAGVGAADRDGRAAV